MYFSMLENASSRLLYPAERLQSVASKCDADWAARIPAIHKMKTVIIVLRMEAG
jgi:hypothetical protein